METFEFCVVVFSFFSNFELQSFNFINIVMILFIQHIFKNKGLQSALMGFHAFILCLHPCLTVKEPEQQFNQNIKKANPHNLTHQYKNQYFDHMWIYQLVMTMSYPIIDSQERETCFRY